MNCIHLHSCYIYDFYKQLVNILNKKLVDPDVSMYLDYICLNSDIYILHSSHCNIVLSVAGPGWPAPLSGGGGCSRSKSMYGYVVSTLH